MTDLVSKFLATPILVIGDLMLDEFIFGSVSRISPEAPVPVVSVSRRRFIPGGAANTAVNAATLGGRVSLIGLRGQDESGSRIEELLEQHQVETVGLVADATRPTTTKTRIIAQTQQVVRIDQETLAPPSEATHQALVEQVRKYAKQTRACVLSDYGKGVVTARFAQECIQACRDANVPILVDPKGTEYNKYAGATLVKPNLLEAGKVLNRELLSTEDVNAAGRDLQKLLGAETSILITRGAQGMTLFEPGGQRVHVPALAREVYDVTGAGDTVAATLALALAVGGSLADACRLAAIAAAVVVAKVGTATCTPEELLYAAHTR